MYTLSGRRCKVSRRLNEDLGLTGGVRTLGSKCKLDSPPGQHGQRRGRRPSDYGVQQAMKQLIRCYYGILQKQFRNCYKKADNQKGSTGENLLRILESRLDNVVYRLGFASTRAEARQMVSHKAVKVNGTVVNIPSFLLKPGDVIELQDKAKQQLRVVASLEQKRPVSHWLDCDPKHLKGIFKAYPDNADFPTSFKVNLVVELFSK